MASIAQEDVLAAVLKLLTVETFQDVRFVCSDGRSVCSNRAFLAARNEYFERLLYGGLCEAGCTEIRLQAPSEAFQHILYHLHTGSFSKFEQEQSWDVIMETCALAQQYMLPGVVEHIAGRAMTDLQPDSVGLALSFALKHDLQPVIKTIWRTGARLLQHPLQFDSTFTADAVCFCLQHTAWLTTPQCATSSCGILDRLSTASSALSLDGSGNGTSNGRQPCMTPSSFNMLNNSSSAAREAAAYDAVLAWTQQQVASCQDCQRSRRVDDDTGRQEDRHAGTRATVPQPKKTQLQATEPSSTGRHMNSSSCLSSSGALHPAGWAASGSQSPFKTVQSPASPSSSRQCPVESAAGTEALARGGGSDSDSDSTCLSSGNASCTTAAPGSPESSSSQASTDAVAKSERESEIDRRAAAGEIDSCCSGYCCEHHESVLLQLLARLNWHLLEPSALDRLESLALLQPSALLGIYSCCMLVQRLTGGGCVWLCVRGIPRISAGRPLSSPDPVLSAAMVQQAGDTDTRNGTPHLNPYRCDQGQEGRPRSFRRPGRLARWLCSGGLLQEGQSDNLGRWLQHGGHESADISTAAG